MEQTSVKKDPQTSFPETNLDPDAYIDLMHFAGSKSDMHLISKQYKGTPRHQVEQVLEYMHDHVLRKNPMHVWNFPPIVLQELLTKCVFRRNESVTQSLLIMIDPDSVSLHNTGQPPAFIKTADPGIDMSLVFEALHRNGSPEPILETDRERSGFQVTLRIHPSFIGSTTEWTPIESTPIGSASNEPTLIRSTLIGSTLIGSTPGGSPPVKSPPEQQSLLRPHPHSAQQAVEKNLGTYLGTFSKSEKETYILHRLLFFVANASYSVKQKELLAYIGLTNDSRNYKRHIKPLETQGLLRRTSMLSPRSPQQSYVLTEKGHSFFCRPSQPQPHPLNVTPNSAPH